METSRDRAAILPHRQHRPLGPAVVLEALTELFLPRDCCGCGAASCTLCEDCLPAFTAAPGLIPAPRYARVPVWSALPYGGAVRHAVLAYKNGGRHDLHALLSLVLAGVIARAAEDLHEQHGLDLGRTVLIVPVPGSGRAVRERGTDLVRELAIRAAAELPELRLEPVALLQAGRRRTQAGLGARERRANLHGTMRLRRAAASRLRGGTVLLIDDVVTTGATLAETGRVCRAAGAAVAGACTLAYRQERGSEAQQALAGETFPGEF
ncbi:ComF family protein [Sediminivirga luteola]|uniref:Phosphoribosyltransferase domain-containing protein n=1 Tax=Sediminivirga luteola TaxID=1774748 RepID=A0A8J2XLH8_9MICO|nr:phosphoribosyltransferase family protein [Sediminivirga luteola]MCI2265616.1 ComF family protein [Sediminivirga luteola]GGA18355.1 hypothetical protein GCM10011333_21750 [Sediminivirga luteola]